MEFVVVLVDDIEIGQIRRAGNVSAARISVALRSVVELVSACVDDGDTGLVEMAVYPIRIGNDFLAWRRRDGALRGLLGFCGHRVMGGLPGHQSSVKDRSTIAEAEVIERPVNARGGRHPVRSEIKNDVRTVRNAELFENGDELLDRRKLQH